MPKMYTEEQKKEIIRRLLEEGDRCMREYGVKKTTVDELVKRVGIPKGTFYLFYKSKELLLFDVVLRIHDTIETGMKQDFQKLALSGRMDVETVTDLFCHYIEEAAKTSMVKLMTGDELSYLISKLPDKTIAEHLLHDDDMTKELRDMLPPGVVFDTQALSGALRAICLVLPYRREIGEENYERSIRMLVHGIVTDMAGALKHTEERKI